VAEQPLQDDVDEEGEELALALLPPAPLVTKPQQERSLARSWLLQAGHEGTSDPNTSVSKVFAH